MKKTIILVLLGLGILVGAYMAFIYYVPYSTGTRAGELIKVSKKGVVFKTWEGEISQGISGAQIFSFSILDDDQEVIEQLNELQGKYVKLQYKERYKTFFIWGDSKYFVTKVTAENSPHINNR
ncbi:6-phosphogluconate dehydrogenase [Formosa sp. PL04]|uniref:6-phosphogluconate dehydrogenase n=1 Tax=Formosa sp. PL04 TaxID=3081755 RepID=UPI0029827DB7|nr:6-phosphogluconate dehydrogenase [Formosa sp. PL04]MDW5289907.1 6-phosphogluconate dehydrogenase [Formosa sp. PL04]